MGTLSRLSVYAVNAQSAVYVAPVLPQRVRLPIRLASGALSYASVHCIALNT